MNEHKYPKRSGKYEWQTQKMYDRLVDMLVNATTLLAVGDKEIEVKMISPWVAEAIVDELIKNGVVLPTFKVGDIVWVRDFMWGVIPCVVDRPYHCRCGNEGECTFEMSFEEKDIGICVFATEEEAREKACPK